MLTRNMWIKDGSFLKEVSFPYFLSFQTFSLQSKINSVTPYTLTIFSEDISRDFLNVLMLNLGGWVRMLPRKSTVNLLKLDNRFFFK